MAKAVARGSLFIALCSLELLHMPIEYGILIGLEGIGFNNRFFPGFRGAFTEVKDGLDIKFPLYSDVDGVGAGAMKVQVIGTTGNWGEL